MSVLNDDFYCAEVLSGRTPVSRVAESDRVLAYHHTSPHWPVHVVVVPKAHVASLIECDDDLLAEVMAVVRRVAADVLGAQGACRVVTNLGHYQDSKHLHWHIGAGETKT